MIDKFYQLSLTLYKKEREKKGLPYMDKGYICCKSTATHSCWFMLWFTFSVCLLWCYGGHLLIFTRHPKKFPYTSSISNCLRIFKVRPEAQGLTSFFLSLSPLLIWSHMHSSVVWKPRGKRNSESCCAWSKRS